MEKYTYKPVVFAAKQYTKEMQDNFIALGKTPKKNPIKVTLDFIPDADLYWNWHTKELEIETKVNCAFVRSAIDVNDFIVKPLSDLKSDYFVLSPENFHFLLVKTND